MDDESRAIERPQSAPEPAPVPSPAPTLSLPSLTLAQIRARTPARVLTGRAGGAYRTATWLELRSDHAAARDAVCDELDLLGDLSASFVAEWGLFEVSTLARSKAEFLLNPERGRALDEPSRIELTNCCPPGADFQVAIADGLSAAAIRVQVPVLLPLLAAEANRRSWRFGQPFFIRHGRVGVLNDIGDVLQPAVVVLLIGERPGLATAESLSAYIAYRPRAGHDDARRNLISNIHARGISHAQAASRIAQFAARMIEFQTSGVAIKEEWKATAPLSLESVPFRVDPR
jgi:ethanolamine ammonia-lyase small subunit